MIYTNTMKWGDSILVRGYDEQGKRVQYKDPFQPTYFLNTKNPSKYKTLHGKSVDSIKPGSIKECTEFIKKYEDVHNFEIHGMNKIEFQHLSDSYPDTISYDMEKIKVAYLDIEVESENGFPEPELATERINAITLQLKNVTYVLGLGKFDLSKFDNDERHYVWYECVTEDELLEKFIEIWTMCDVDVVSGWNILMYDIPYIVNRISKILDPVYTKKLSPWGILKEHRSTYFQTEKQTYTIGGISILDYQKLYTKYRLIPRESYKLDHIAGVELGHKKLDWKQHYPSMKDFYRSDFQMFIEYNIIDVDLVRKLDEKLNLIPLHISLSYFAKINYDDTFSPVRMWDAIIYNKLKENDIVIPFKTDYGDKETQYAGAFVKDPVVGLHDWVVSFDLTSLYPSLICQYNISPETIVDRSNVPQNLKRKNISVDSLLNKSVDLDELSKYPLCIAANGEYFKTDVNGFIPQLMKELMKSRSTSKKQMLSEKKEIEKIKHIMNERGLL